MFGSAQCIVVPGLLIFLSLSAATPVGMVQGSVATHVGQATERQLRATHVCHWRRSPIMAFQVVELTLDADDKVIERRAVPYPYQTRAEAVDTIESVMTRFAEAGYEPEGDFWWAINGNGKTRVRFIIEHV
jgi:hypothetical protein